MNSQTVLKAIDRARAAIAFANDRAATKSQLWIETMATIMTELDRIAQNAQTPTEPVVIEGLSAFEGPRLVLPEARLIDRRRDD
jgi:hypothetical protein